MTLECRDPNVTVECHLGGRVSQAEKLDVGLGPDGVVLVAVAGLSTGSAFRLNGLCADQVDRIAELGGTWPPILVRGDGLVIDGGHRVAAARRLGMARIAATYFDGGADEAFVEFVRRNVAHGLVLSLGERKQAATRVLQLHPAWSDRRIAEICALSPKTVGRLRLTVVTHPADTDLSDVEVREGRDRRNRPVRRGSVRGRVVEALREQPQASLRTIAAAVGVSPETVRLVRLNLATIPEVEIAELPSHVVVDLGEPATAVDDSWQSDTALASSDRGGDLLAWMDTTRIDPTDLSWADSVPLSRVYVLAEEARRRSDLWLQMAKALEARPARAR